MSSIIVNYIDLSNDVVYDKIIRYGIWALYYFIIIIQRSLTLLILSNAVIFKPIFRLIRLEPTRLKPKQSTFQLLISYYLISSNFLKSDLI